MSHDTQSKFVKRIKSLYLPDKPDSEISQQKMIAKDLDPAAILNKAAGILDCNVNHFKRSSRIPLKDRDNRNLLIYLIWETGICSNQKIADLLGLTYSAISRRVGAFKSRINKEKGLLKKYKTIKS